MEEKDYEGVPLRAPTHEEIALRAWCIYEKSPDHHGLDKEHWAEAQKQLTEELRRDEAPPRPRRRIGDLILDRLNNFLAFLTRK